MRCSTPGKVRSAAAIAASGEPGGARRRGRGRGVLAVVRTGDQRLRRERVVGRELDARTPRREPARSRVARRRRRPPPGARRPGASRPRRRRRCRGGRGDLARGCAARRSAGAACRRPRAGTTRARRRSSVAGSTAPTSEVSGRPMLPATSTGTPAAWNIAPRSAVVVVLPFVPVTPTIGFASRRAPSSISEITLDAGGRAATTGARILGDTRALDDELDAVEEHVVPLPESHLGPDPGDVDLRRAVVRDDVRPAEPQRTTAARPERASPTTRVLMGGMFDTSRENPAAARDHAGQMPRPAHTRRATPRWPRGPLASHPPTSPPGAGTGSGSNPRNPRASPLVCRRGGRSRRDAGDTRTEIRPYATRG